MRFITKKFMPRRTFLRGVGATLALPLLESMVPAATPLAKTAADPVRRLGFVFMPMGCDQSRWTPPGGANDTGSGFGTARSMREAAGGVTVMAGSSQWRLTCGLSRPGDRCGRSPGANADR